jgi:hypothetical protein
MERAADTFDSALRRWCEEAHLNLAYRWFCRLQLDGCVPDHSTFSKNRHGRFRESDLLRSVRDRPAALHRRGLVGEAHLVAVLGRQIAGPSR